MQWQLKGFELTRYNQTKLKLRGGESGLINKASRHMDVASRAVTEDAFCVFVFSPLSPTLPPEQTGNQLQSYQPGTLPDPAL